MKNTKFTPGNWQVEPVEASSKPRGLVYLRINSGKSIAFAGVYKDKGIDEAEARANAALIAAAPKLYAAAVAYLGTTPREAYHEQDDAEYQMARNALLNALAKARGEMTAQQILEREG